MALRWNSHLPKPFYKRPSVAICPQITRQNLHPSLLLFPHSPYPQLHPPANQQRAAECRAEDEGRMEEEEEEKANFLSPCQSSSGRPHCASAVGGVRRGPGAELLLFRKNNISLMPHLQKKVVVKEFTSQIFSNIY